MGGCPRRTLLAILSLARADAVVGLFQDCHQRRQHAASRNCPLVRRLTGGGAILHDVELTYSLVVHGGHPLATERDLLYQSVHTALIDALCQLGITAVLPGRQSPPRRAGAAVVLPTPRPGDVLGGANEDRGSASVAARAPCLQHGSLLLGRSTSPRN